MITAAVALGVWAILATAGCLAMHRARRAAPPRPRPPLRCDLEGYELDAKYYAVIAEAWR